VGLLKSGKSIMAKQLATRYGFQYISLTEYLDDIAKSRGIVGGHWRDLGISQLNYVKSKEITF